MSIFSEAEYEKLHGLVFRSDYPGYKPTVVEIPNGDGKPDAEKRYAHIAPKYLVTPEQQAALMPFLERAHKVALRGALALDLPWKYFPDIRYGALRILDYPSGAISNRHEDFDLFTLMCYRDRPEYFKSDEFHAGPAIEVLRDLNSQAHLGQLGEAIGLGRATPHWVAPSMWQQRSIVYFSIPDHDSVLPSGVTVRDWLNERMVRSRTEFKAYK